MLLSLNGAPNPTQFLIQAIQQRPGGTGRGVNTTLGKDEDFYLALINPDGSREIVKLLSGDPSRGALSLETEDSLRTGQVVQVSHAKDRAYIVPPAPRHAHSRSSPCRPPHVQCPSSVRRGGTPPSGHSDHHKRLHCAQRKRLYPFRRSHLGVLCTMGLCGRQDIACIYLFSLSLTCLASSLAEMLRIFCCARSTPPSAARLYRDNAWSRLSAIRQLCWVRGVEERTALQNSGQVECNLWVIWAQIKR